MNGKFELRGGSLEDQQAAREWVKQFMPEVAATLPKAVDRAHQKSDGEGVFDNLTLETNRRRLAA